MWVRASRSLSPFFLIQLYCPIIEHFLGSSQKFNQMHILRKHIDTHFTLIVSYYFYFYVFSRYTPFFFLVFFKCKLKFVWPMPLTINMTTCNMLNNKFSTRIHMHNSNCIVRIISIPKRWTNTKALVFTTLRTNKHSPFVVQKHTIYFQWQNNVLYFRTACIELNGNRNWMFSDLMIGYEMKRWKWPKGVHRLLFQFIFQCYQCVRINWCFWKWLKTIIWWLWAI